MEPQHRYDESERCALRTGCTRFHDTLARLRRAGRED